jgi:hypothetical protein
MTEMGGEGDLHQGGEAVQVHFTLLGRDAEAV